MPHDRLRIRKVMLMHLRVIHTSGNASTSQTYKDCVSTCHAHQPSQIEVLGTNKFRGSAQLSRAVARQQPLPNKFKTKSRGQQASTHCNKEIWQRRHQTNKNNQPPSRSEYCRSQQTKQPRNTQLPTSPPVRAKP